MTPSRSEEFSDDASLGKDVGEDVGDAEATHFLKLVFGDRRHVRSSSHPTHRIT